MSLGIFFQKTTTTNVQDSCKRCNGSGLYFPLLPQSLIFFLVAHRVEIVMHVRQMIDNRRWDETHVTVELEKEASSGHLVRTHALLTL